MLNPDYNLLLALITSLIVLGYCVQELLASYLFSEADREELNKNNQE